MRVYRFSRLIVALWLGVVALAANAVQQQQLTSNILAAISADLAAVAAPASYHVMPDGTVMAGAMGMSSHQRDAAGHTHRGHGDCEVCGSVAAIAAFTLPVLPVLPIPQSRAEASATIARDLEFRAASYAPYASRAPPVSLI